MSLRVHIKPMVTSEQLKTIYQSNIRSIMEYCEDGYTTLYALEIATGYLDSSHRRHIIIC